MTEKTRLTLKKKAEDISISERLHKVLATSGVASRRSVEDRIARGDVLVNGEVAQVGAQVNAGDRLQIDGKSLIVKGVPGSFGRVLIYNKPDGEVTSRNDPEGRPTVFEKLPKLRGARWISIGRLDINTQGLLIFTSNGELAHKLSHPTQGFRREYVCRIHGEPSQEALDKLLSGVELEDGVARFDVLEAMESAGGSNEWYRVEISEGRNREVRRLWEAVGFTVSRLKRTRFGPFSLPKGLNRGELAELSEEDVYGICSEVGLPSPPPALVVEDEGARKLRRVRKGAEVVVAAGTGKKLKAERAYLGYLGGHITGEERPQRTTRHSPDDRFDPRAKRRGMPGKGGRLQPGAPGAAARGRGGKPVRGRGGKEAQPRIALPGYEAPTTFTYDPMTGEFAKAPVATPGARRGGPQKPRGRGPERGAEKQASVSGLFRSEPSYKPPVYTSVIDPETGERDGNRYVPEPVVPLRDDSQPRPREARPNGNPNANSGGRPNSGNPANADRNGGRRRGGGGGGRNNNAPRKPRPEGAPANAGAAAMANAGPADPNVAAGNPAAQPGKKRRRFRRRRGGGGAPQPGGGGGNANGGGGGHATGQSAPSSGGGED